MRGENYARTYKLLKERERERDQKRLPASRVAQSRQDEVEPMRLLSTNWCWCGHRVLMETIRENRCYEIQQIAAEIDSRGVPCIIQYPGFALLCLNVHVLRTSWFNQQYGHAIADDNNRYRYIAYRMLVRYVWGYLGRDIRVILSACAVSCIRRHFPSSEGDYTDYLEPDF